jgi:hypothetical protein
MITRGLASFCLAVMGMLPAISPAQAQEKNEIGLVIGATVTPQRTLAAGGTNLNFKPALSLGAEYDRRVFERTGLAISFGGDFLASPLDVKLENPPSTVSRQYAFLFLTPHVRAKFGPGNAVQPWLLFGGGYARFLEAKPPADPSFVPGTNTGALLFGGGADTQSVVQLLRIPIGFRAEVRDFYSGSPRFGQPVRGGLQHNVVFTAGLLFKF